MTTRNPNDTPPKGFYWWRSGTYDDGSPRFILKPCETRPREQQRAARIASHFGSLDPHPGWLGKIH